MKNRIRAIIFTLTTIAVSGCSNSGGGTLTCSFPCIDTSPTATPSTITSATGGTVTVAFHLNGNITEVNNVSIILSGTNPFNPVFPIGTGLVFNPISNDISIDIPIASGVVNGSYYPVISVTANAVNTGANYYIDPTKSSSSYTYTEVLNGVSTTPQGSSLSIPVITVQ